MQDTHTHRPVLPSLLKHAFLSRIPSPLVLTLAEHVRARCSLVSVCESGGPFAGCEGGHPQIKMPKSKRNVSEKTKQRKMDVRDRKIKKLAALHPLRCSGWRDIFLFPSCARNSLKDGL